MTAPTYAPPSAHVRYRLTVQWDGTHFAGWQSQPNARSVQDDLHAAFKALGMQAFRPVAAGRTDAGVHAEAMPVHVDALSASARIPAARLARALNAHLPTDVAVLDAAPAPAHFHARFSCTERAYSYRVLNAPQRQPLWAGRALLVHAPLDVAAMQVAATQLLGEHDFAAFATREERQTVRRLHALEVRPVGPLLEVHVRGESFLRHMVRGIVGTLLMVGEGRLGASDVAGILVGRARSGAGPNVPPHGLYFTDASYAPRAEASVSE
ncbi:tRNA pseudouridine(38-40) synthase TruA [Deinococcus maricopensis]|uniref:tRNA pseudouridine synthase A n=1 Tax=Deinococcus maricopensis (strain DSM 21211 / LMG 22137 / NRRL B-23946 / LB-34) TaxID=709986 RepID=E8U518_DEIML|nr:tRNA pseudouridine(38-40) synthase TruA [Deinococcus maricopensis]ADV66157.1 tRNA pseudouridine synthase A [Deinococcus maricopensis DSM 21211]